MCRVASTDGGGEAHGTRRWIDLGAIDDLAPVEDCIVRSLAESLGQAFQHRAKPHLFGTGLVSGERARRK